MQSLKVMFLSVVFIFIFSASALAQELQDSQSPQIPEAALKAAAAARATHKPLPDVEPRTPRDRAKIVGKDGYCIDCHRQETPGIFEEWVLSSHARLGIGCNDCHGAYSSDKDSFLHAGRFHIRTVVSPLRCGRCHKEAIRGYGKTAHAKALTNLEEMQPDDLRYPLIEPYKESGFTECRACHGGRILIGEDRRPTPATWPNSGAGRINPDKSPGNCAICHGRHRFSAASARQPEACLSCHDGRMYPEGEIYARSLHGLTYRDDGSRRNLERPYFYCDATQNTAPTCALCHLNGAGLGLITTHNPAERLSHHLTHPQASEREGQSVLRQSMTAVCEQCHAGSVIKRFFAAADAELQRYQTEEVEPALAEFGKLLKKKKGKKREKILADYADFLARSKAYRLNLYMGHLGRSER